MKPILLLMVLAALLAGCAAETGGAGFQTASLPLAGDRPTFLLFFTDP